ncbi:MAG: FAD-binding oxidoreductase [Solirubrobacteraceae bacterium]
MTNQLFTNSPAAWDTALATAITPGDPAYEGARRGFNLAIDQHPDAIAYPSTAAEVSDLVRAARAAGLRIAVQGGAHNAGPQGDLRNTLLIRTNRLNAVEIDPRHRIARAEAGVRWEAVVDAAAAHGLAALHGSSPTVGVVGYSLGGGLSWQARKRGLQANHVTAVEIVLADGTECRIDADHDPELLWALRGGLGNFGVVTAIEFRLFPVTELYAGWLAWDWSHAEQVLDAWAMWTRTTSDDVTTSARILQLPPLPELPEPIRGRQLVVIDGAILGHPDAAAEMLTPLRALVPELDTFAPTPAPALCRLHGDPEEAAPYISESAMLKELTPATIEAFVKAAGPESGSTLAVAELRQLGGALSRPVAGGATSHFDGACLAFALGMALDPEMAAASARDAEKVVSSLAPWTGGRPYLNFVEQETDVSQAFGPAAWARLQEVRGRVDPDGVFRANHVI